MSIIGDGIMLGTGGESASIFVTGLSETDSVSATHKIPTKVENPDYHDLPDGYTELRYIQSSGTQYVTVPTPIVSNGFDIEFSLYSAQQPSGFQPLFVSVIDYGLWLGWYDGSFIVRTFNHDNIITVSYPFGTFVNVKVVYDGSTVELYFNNVKVGSGSVNFADGAAITYIFYDGSTKISCKLGAFKFSVGNTAVYHYIPASNSSDAVGLYDLVNGVFYTNAGTGTFNAGAEVPQYVDEYVDGKTVVGKWVQKQTQTYVEIPPMTSNTEPNGECLASSVLVADRDVYKAFDGNTNSSWVANAVPTSSNPQWIQYKFDSPVAVTKMDYYAVENDNSRVRDCVIQCSTDGINFIDVYATNIPTSPALVTIEFDNSIYAQYWRLKILSNNGNTANVYAVDIQFYGTKTEIVSGFEIAPIKSYGTWTVTCIRGESQRKKTVLIDSADMYSIKFNFRLPNGYTELSHIISTEGAYMDTGINLNTLTNMTLQALAPAIDAVIAGAWKSGAGFMFGVSSYPSGGITYRTSSGGNWTDSGIYPDGNYHLFEMNYTSGLYVDGKYVTGAVTRYSVNVHMFGANGYGAGYADVSIKSCQMFNGETKLRDFVPSIRDSDDAVGMYDLVSNSFFMSATSNGFIAGEVV